ncbi:MAG: AAA family ATPase, partial [Proteobacteria bacterium]|nr:AAA family ATPase [Pseudomonadota bacterium]
MSKSKTVFLCSSCGGQTQKWAGQCPHCHEWNVLKETMVNRGGDRYQSLSITDALIPIGAIKASEEARFSTHSSELDRVLGGGLVRGGVVLIGGDPGIGKSTLLLQAMSAMSEHHKAIYVSGEESSQQIGLRAQRLDLKSEKLLLLSEIQINRILETLNREKPDVVVI